MKKNKKLDIMAIAAGVITVAVLVTSVASCGMDAIKLSKRVSSISDIKVPEVPNVTTNRKTGVISVDEWKSYYPEIYASLAMNKDNVGTDGVRLEYPEETPQIVTLYDGMAFSKDYGEAIGHTYTLDDISKTTRPHKLANCLTCKTPDFTALVNNLGTEVYSQPFDSVYSQVSESVTCYSCHANTPGTIVISSDYMAKAMQDEIDSKKVDSSNVSCAQCHIEYYFDPQTKATSVPYDSLENMNPDSILAYYNKMGFVDYTNKMTEVGQIKVQHPEFETYMGEGSVHKNTYTCADCHMGVSYDKKGNPYANHNLTSPLDNKDLIKETCSVCHKDLASQVRAIQENVTERENEIADLLVEINQRFADKLERGRINDKKADKVRSLIRDAQFYWDFVYVENSEGAHNSKLAKDCLDKAENLAKQALEIVK